jgi:hypothetical protein
VARTEGVLHGSESSCQTAACPGPALSHKRVPVGSITPGGTHDADAVPSRRDGSWRSQLLPAAPLIDIYPSSRALRTMPPARVERCFILLLRPVIGSVPTDA